MRVSYKLHTPGMDFPVTSVAFSPDERWLAAGSWNNTIKLWDVVTGRELRTIAGHSDFVNTVAFSPDGRWLASGSAAAVLPRS